MPCVVVRLLVTAACFAEGRTAASSSVEHAVLNATHGFVRLGRDEAPPAAYRNEDYSLYPPIQPSIASGWAAGMPVDWLGDNRRSAGSGPSSVRVGPIANGLLARKQPPQPALRLQPTAQLVAELARKQPQKPALRPQPTAELVAELARKHPQKPPPRFQPTAELVAELARKLPQKLPPPPRPPQPTAELVAESARKQPQKPPPQPLPTAELVADLDAFFGIDRSASASPPGAPQDTRPSKPQSARAPHRRPPPKAVAERRPDPPRTAAPLRFVAARVGLRVVRGPDWRWGEQDGGPGSVGIVAEDGGQKHGWCMVRWPNGHENGYRVGDGGYYDLVTGSSPGALVGPEPAAAARNPLEASQPYPGSRPPGGAAAWRRLAEEEHSDRHPATRPDSSAIWQLRPGVRVARGPDWRWDNQDGGPGSAGVVLSIERSGWISVRWASGYENGYRMGAEGMFDLQVAGKGSSLAPVATRKASGQQPRQEPQKGRRCCWCIDQFGDVLHLP